MLRIHNIVLGICPVYVFIDQSTARTRIASRVVITAGVEVTTEGLDMGG